MSWESIDARQVSQVERQCDSWENRASGTGALTPARTDLQLNLRRSGRNYRLMPHFTDAPQVCEPSRAVDHTSAVAFKVRPLNLNPGRRDSSLVRPGGAA